jgi:DNA-binding IclR family transcriptional regulator
MNKEAMRAFMGRFMEMTTGAAVMGVVAVADRIGLFSALAGAEPLTLDGVAELTGLERRYLQEILATLSAAEILSFDEANDTYALPARLDPDGAGAARGDSRRGAGLPRGRRRAL